jgi:hypothetical protein
LATKLKPSPTSAASALRQLTHVKDRKLICPNALIIDYADQLLGYQGALFGAYELAFVSR